MLFLNKLILHETARLNNTTFPVEPYLTSETFPEQDVEKLGTIANIQFRDFNSNGSDKDCLALRIRQITTVILRYDIVEPYKVITMAIEGREKGSIFVIDRTENDDILNYIAVCPVQRYSYYLKPVKDVYYDFDFLDKYVNGTVVRCDDGEPVYAVIAEITPDDYLRFIVADEAICMIDAFAPKTEEYKEIDVYNYIQELLEEYPLYGQQRDDIRDSESAR